jgi:glucans biosynthesis protein C
VPGRLRHVDDLKILLTAGVITGHAAITYGAEGSWFYTEHGPEALTVPLALGAIWGMGLFFFLAGAFTPASVARKGAARFLADRWLRLGVPFAVFVALVVPAVQWWADGGTAADAWEEQWRDLDAGPLWFVGVLLLFSTIAVPFLRPGEPGAVPGRALVLAAAAIVVLTFVVRLRWEIDSDQPFAAHVWQWGQCIVLFALGIDAGRRGWFTRIPAVLRRRCIAIGLVAGVGVAVLVGASGDDLDPLGGGVRPQAAATAVLEGVICVCAAMALTDLFRGRTRRGRLSAELARAAYAAFILQAPVLVGLALALRDSGLPALAKFAIVAPLGVALSFAAGAVLLRVPVLARIL